ncbi:MAG: toll/interleukin-1 receptor domain-containing protein [Armatimonadetes bacterium]|nr:toll/interleukin-1 receptor domain-containing protein [Armatimonadota bacterium]
MIEIRHKDTGEALHRVAGETLAGADLAEANLIRANLAEANLHGADLAEAHLAGANLTKANLHGADLKWADLEQANLTKANLIRANLVRANLVRANLAGAGLHHAILDEADLTGANLTGARLFATIFARIKSLHLATGLDEVEHSGPSSLDAATLRASAAHLPVAFLQGCGYTLEEIETLRALYTTPIQFYSCFLSHASTDGEFADRLHTDLLAQDVSCWHYRYDMRAGQFWRVQINEAIKLHDKLVLVCSRDSLRRRNVVDEIIAAIERERETGTQKLFPIRLDDFILGGEMLQIADARMAAGEWREDWVRYVKAYYIPDFSRWKEHGAYQAEFQKLLRDLKQPPKRGDGGA